MTATAVVAPLVTDAARSTGALDPRTASASAWAVPCSLLVLVLRLVVALIGSVRVVRRNRRRRAALEAARVLVAVDLALRERATSSS